MLQKIWSGFDATFYVCLSIVTQNVHEVLSLCGLCVSITYAVLKLKRDFLNKK